MEVLGRAGIEITTPRSTIGLVLAINWASLRIKWGSDNEYSTIQRTKPVIGVLTNRDTCTQISVDKLEKQNFACIKFRYDACQKVNKKNADQTARMRRLICTFVVRRPHRREFSRRGPFVNKKGEIN